MSRTSGLPQHELSAQLLRITDELSDKFHGVFGRETVAKVVDETYDLLAANATVTVCHTGTPDIARFTREADIAVFAMGVPRSIGAEYIRPGAVVIDVGTTRVEDPSTKSGFRIAGDVRFDENGGSAFADGAAASPSIPLNEDKTQVEIAGEPRARGIIEIAVRHEAGQCVSVAGDDWNHVAVDGRIRIGDAPGNEIARKVNARARFEADQRVKLIMPRCIPPRENVEELMKEDIVERGVLARQTGAKNDCGAARMRKSALNIGRRLDESYLIGEPRRDKIEARAVARHHGVETGALLARPSAGGPCVKPAKILHTSAVGALQTNGKVRGREFGHVFVVRRQDRPALFRRQRPKFCGVRSRQHECGQG